MEGLGVDAGAEPPPEPSSAGKFLSFLAKPSAPVLYKQKCYLLFEIRYYDIDN